jgi:hypothetical protein
MTEKLFGKQVSPEAVRHRKMLGPRQSHRNGIEINLDKGQVLSLSLVSDGKEPLLAHVNGDEFLKDAKLRDMELLLTTREIVSGPMVDTYILKIKTSKGVCRLSYRHETGGAVYLYFKKRL